MDPSRILALIPAFNESAHIAEIIQRTKSFLPVLVVDDGSSDNTSEIALAAGAEVLRQNPNQGKGAALQAGFRYALENKKNAVVTLDADGQHAPEEIPLFVAEFENKQSDLVIGYRNFQKMPLGRRISNTFGTWMFSCAIRQPIRDNQSGYRLLSARLMQSMLISRESGFEYEVEMIVRCIKQQMKLDWVPIQTIYSGQGSHIHPLHHGYHFLRMVLKTWRTIRETGQPL